MKTASPDPIKTLRLVSVFLGMMLSAVVVDRVRADWFLLKEGGRIRGRWLNRDERPFDVYRIETESGGRLTLARSQVKQAVYDRPAEIEYRRIAPSVPDTAAAQWEFAEWCREHYLLRERRRHLERVVQLDPDHEKARRALGYGQLDGQWVPTSRMREALGLQYYHGRWRLAQEVELLEARRLKQQSQRAWWTKLKHWRAALGTEKADSARRNILAIRDPVAVPALATMLAGELYRPVKMLYIETLSRIESADAGKVLIRTSLDDADVEIHVACVDRIVRRHEPGALKAYVAALRSNNNFVVNRAAAGLGRLGDKSAVAPLIEALVTTHVTVVKPAGGGSPGSMTTSFLKPGSAGNGTGGAYPSSGTGLSAGNRTQTLVRRVFNEEVLGALTALSDGVNLGYDQRAWRVWHAAEQSKAPAVKGRRD